MRLLGIILVASMVTEAVLGWRGKRGGHKKRCKGKKCCPLCPPPFPPPPIFPPPILPPPPFLPEGFNPPNFPLVRAARRFPLPRQQQQQQQIVRLFGQRRPTPVRFTTTISTTIYSSFTSTVYVQQTHCPVVCGAVGESKLGSGNIIFECVQQQQQQAGGQGAVGPQGLQQQEQKMIAGCQGQQGAVVPGNYRAPCPGMGEQQQQLSQQEQLQQQQQQQTYPQMNRELARKLARMSPRQRQKYWQQQQQQSGLSPSQFQKYIGQCYQRQQQQQEQQQGEYEMPGGQMEGGQQQQQQAQPYGYMSPSQYKKYVERYYQQQQQQQQQGFGPTGTYENGQPYGSGGGYQWQGGQYEGYQGQGMPAVPYEMPTSTCTETNTSETQAYSGEDLMSESRDGNDEENTTATESDTISLRKLKAAAESIGVNKWAAVMLGFVGLVAIL